MFLLGQRVDNFLAHVFGMSAWEIQCPMKLYLLCDLSSMHPGSLKVLAILHICQVTGVLII